MTRPAIKNSNILITGGAGFIGSHLVECLLEEAKNIIIIDNLFLGSEENIKDALKKDNVIFYKDDCEFISSLEYIFDKHKIDIVFNLATKALNYSFINPKEAFDTNIKVILNLLELQRKKAFKTLCHFSSSEVYGTAIYEPMDEKHPINPTTTYAGGKAAADIAVYSYVNMFNLDAFIVRPFNNYGEKQNYKGYLAGVIPITIYRILKGENPQIYGDGSQSRDFIYAKDTVNSIIKLYPMIKAAESVNISTDNMISIKTVIKKICKIMNCDKDILYKDIRKADVKTHNACNKKIKSLIDYNITPFEEGLKKTISWYIKNIKI